MKQKQQHKTLILNRRLKPLLFIGFCEIFFSLSFHSLFLPQTSPCESDFFLLPSLLLLLLSFYALLRDNFKFMKMYAYSFEESFSLI